MALGSRRDTIEVGALYRGEVRKFLKLAQFDGYNVRFIESSGLLESEFVIYADELGMEKVRRDFNALVRWVRSIDREIELENRVRKEKSMTNKIFKRTYNAFHGDTKFNYIWCRVIQGDTKLHYFCRLNDIGRVKQDLSDGGLINSQNRKGETPLMIAYKTGSHDLFRELLRYLPDIHVEDRDGKNILNMVSGYPFDAILDSYLVNLRR